MGAFSDDFGDLLYDVLAVQLTTGRDREGGSLTWGTAQSVTGRWVRKPRLMKDASGADVRSSSFVRIPPVDGLTVEGLITLPDGTSPPIVAIEVSPDEGGALYAMRVSFV